MWACLAVWFHSSLCSSIPVFQTTLEQDIISDRPNPSKRIFLTLFQTKRPDDIGLDEQVIKRDARDIIDIGTRWRSDEARFLRLLCSRRQVERRSSMWTDVSLHSFWHQQFSIETNLHCVSSNEWYEYRRSYSSSLGWHSVRVLYHDQYENIFSCCLLNLTLSFSSHHPEPVALLRLWIAEKSSSNPTRTDHFRAKKAFIFSVKP